MSGLIAKFYKTQNSVYTYANASEEDASGLKNNSDDGLLEQEPPLQIAQRSIWSRYRNLIVAHFILLVVYSAVLVQVATRLPPDPRSFGLPFSPATEMLEFEERRLPLEDRIQEQSVFVGQPSPALDKAWHNLLNYENIKLEPEVMKHWGRGGENSGVPTPEEDGYIGTLNVYHELHCLKRIHQSMYPEYYWPEYDEHRLEMVRLHNEHCIDYLRQSAMCHGDVGLITFEWKSYSRVPLANATAHQCVKWDKLDAWTRARSVDMMKPGWLVHPTLGLAYPEGEGDKIGVVMSNVDGHDQAGQN